MLAGPAAAPAAAAIGALLPLSGAYKSFGEAWLRGIRLALGAVGDRPPLLRTVVLDTRSDPQEALRAYQTLAAEPGVLAVLGPHIAAEIDSVRLAAAAAAMPTLTFSQRPLPANGAFVRFSMTTDDQARVLTQYLLGEREIRRWAIFYPDDGYGRDLADSFRHSVEAWGGRVRAEVAYDPTKKDLQEEAKRLQAKIGVVENQAPPIDAVFLPDTAERIAVVAPYLSFVDIRGVLLAGASGWNRPAALEHALPVTEGAVFVDGFFLYSFAPAVRAFVDSFRDAYHSDPGILEAYAYDAASWIRDLILAGAGDRATVLARLRQPAARTGATGLTRVTRDGQIEKSLFLLTFREGSVREVERGPDGSTETTPPGGAPAPVPVEGWRQPEYDSRRRAEPRGQ